MEARGWEDCSDLMSRPEDWQEGGGEGCEGAGGGEAPAADQERKSEEPQLRFVMFGYGCNSVFCKFTLSVYTL